MREVPATDALQMSFGGVDLRFLIEATGTLLQDQARLGLASRGMGPLLSLTRMQFFGTLSKVGVLGSDAFFCGASR